MSTLALACPGLTANTDISGPGVRIALYLQSLLSVVLVRFSPEDAPGAYWSMTSTALGLITSSIITSILGQISLLDAIIVVYVLLLPILASAFGISEIASSQSKNRVRRVYSPLLILANWIRSACTYSFAMYVWATAPTFGSGPPECNAATKLIFFGASLPALGSGRKLNLAGWGLLTVLFMWRTLKGGTTILVATRALFSSSAGDVLLKPKRPPENEINLETEERYNYRTGVYRRTERAYRPAQIFHEVLQGITRQILALAPSGSGLWYKDYGQLILACVLSAWAIAMTELELSQNNLLNNVNSVWGFGQVLPMVLTISPLFSLYEHVLSRRSAGPVDETRTIRITVRNATGLQRPKNELDDLPTEKVEALDPEVREKIQAPSPFAVITVDERHMYVTYDQQDTADPDWTESFDVRVGHLSTVVIRVFDLKCLNNSGWSSMIGFTAFLPFSVLAPPVLPVPNPTYALNRDRPTLIPRPDPTSPTSPTTALPDSGPAVTTAPSPLPPTVVAEATITTLDDYQQQVHENGMDRIATVTLPLVRNGITIPEMTITISLTTEVDSPLPPPKLPPRFSGHKQTHISTRVGIVSFRGRRMGSRRITTTETHWLP